MRAKLEGKTTTTTNATGTVVYMGDKRFIDRVYCDQACDHDPCLFDVEVGGRYRCKETGKYVRTRVMAL